MKYLKDSKVFTIFLSVIFLFSIQTNIHALSIEDEKKAGQEFLQSVKQHLVLIDDPFAKKFIDDFGQYLLKSVETKHFDFRFFIVKEDVLNAFAGPGGVIFLYAGLIEAMEEVDELASVVCHEIAHVSSRHISNRADQFWKLGLATMAGILAGALVGGDAAEAIMVGSLAAGQQKQLSYSREDERQADQVGFKYIVRSGFNPAAVKSSLMKIQEGRWGINEIPAYLLTHPIGPERISNIETMLSSPIMVPAKRETLRFRKTYPLFRTVIMAKYIQKYDMVQYYNSRLLKTPDSPLSHFGLGLALIKKGNYSESITHLEKAIEGLDEPLPALRYLSEAYLGNGEAAKAIAILEKALEKDRNDKVTLLTIAKSYLDSGAYNKATEIYERLIYMEPVDDEAFYNLGFSYGKQGKVGLAHYNFGLFHKKSHNPREAFFHFNEAKKAASNDPVLLKKIEASIAELEKEDKGKWKDKFPEEDEF
ncbi:M48 family metalloprotease [Thermodesulfobacteriota bacterium]